MLAGCGAAPDDSDLPTEAALVELQRTSTQASQFDASPELVARGERLWGRCAVCHQVGSGARHAAGPELNDLLGRVAGSSTGFGYSQALRDSELRWTAEALDVWLTNPYRLFPGTSMSFGGIRDAADRQAVIAYLIEQGKTENSSQ